jgi:hypothetical protein
MNFFFHLYPVTNVSDAPHYASFWLQYLLIMILITTVLQIGRSSFVAQRKRVGLITQRSEDRNFVELRISFLSSIFYFDWDKDPSPYRTGRDKDPPRPPFLRD